jgi:bifunctional DNA-binding transcriptional regulator/antitoxin component of YhaV-PrlF toxin-antitoxin module
MGRDEVSWPANVSTGRRLRLPPPVMDALGAKEGDTLRFTVRPGSNEVRVMKLERSL